MNYIINLNDKYNNDEEKIFGQYSKLTRQHPLNKNITVDSFEEAMRLVGHYIIKHDQNEADYWYSIALSLPKNSIYYDHPIKGKTLINKFKLAMEAYAIELNKNESVSNANYWYNLAFTMPDVPVKLL